MATTNIIGLRELREKTEDFIEKIEKGKSFVVVKRSHPVFKIVPVDMWGDEGLWESVADFTEVNKKGVSAKYILKSLHKLNGSHK